MDEEEVSMPPIIQEEPDELMPVKNGILWEVKKLLGVSEKEACYDLPLSIAIDSAFYALWQMGVGPEKPFHVSNESMWEDFLPSGEVEAIKQYIYLKVKSTFDPPSSNALIDAYDRQLKEVEWRLYIQSDGRRGGLSEEERLTNALRRVGDALGF